MTAIAPPYSAPNTAESFVCELDLIRPSTLNPRKRFAEDKLEELAASIRQHGLLEPLVVREVAGESIAHPEPGYTSERATYELIAGERRRRAATLAGLDAVPVRNLGPLDDRTALRLALVENLQRQDLDPIEEAEGYARLNRVVGLTQTQIAAAVNRSQPAIANAMRLLKLPEDVRARIGAGALTVSHGLALLRYQEFPAVASALAGLAVEHHTTSRELEGELPHTSALVKARLVREITWQTPWKDTCAACPFGARRSSPYTIAYCLKPAHYDELAAAHDAAEAAAREAAVATSRAAQAATGAHDATVDGEPAPGLVRLADLRYDAYHQFQAGEALPVGCSPDCPCRARAIASRWDYELRTQVDGGVVEVCLDPQRRRQLQAAQTKAEKRAKRERHKGEVAALTAALADLAAPGPRELVVLVASILRSGLGNEGHTAAVRDACAAEGLHAEVYLDRDPDHGGHYRALAQLPPATVLRLGLGVLLRRELHDRYLAEYGTGGALAGWYLHAPAGQEAADR
ncbi:MAG TPA: ParB/RepB/Spo0J family partition protein [Thermomicrobiales bacterium]|nr:ParB/RepB/Spo0J family partition protein [Thermomicrobiales bacterium]